MSIPDYLEDKIRLFKGYGRVFRENEELFNDTSWFSVLTGQNIRPDRHDPVADVLDEAETARRMENIRSVIATSANYMPKMADFIAETCQSDDVDLPGRTGA